MAGDRLSGRLTFVQATESSKSEYLAPQTGFEPIAFWLTLLSHISGFWAGERETAGEGSAANCEEHRCGRTAPYAFLLPATTETGHPERQSLSLPFPRV